MKNNILLLKTLLLATSQTNIYKYSNDAKKKKRIRAAFIGKFCIYAMLVGYSFAACMGYGAIGLTQAIPLLCALIISLLAFVFTFFKTNGYLFNFKEYDMLMSLPFESSTVAGCKFLYMYIKTLPWFLSISIAMLAGFSISAHPGALTYPLWIVLSLFLPIIPMLFSSFLGFLIAKVSSGFKKTNYIQTILTFIFIILCFSLRYIIEAVIRNDQVENTIQKTYEITKNSADIYLPAKWFAMAAMDGNILSALLLIISSVVLFWILFVIVGRSYRNINSGLRSHAASKKYKISTLKKSSVVNAIAYKEFKRMTGSTTYITNIGIGVILAFGIGVISLIFGVDKIVAVVTNGAPFDYSLIQPSIPFIVYFFIGMVASTACSPSLEGKNYWILQSLPLEKKTIFQGKMLFNMYLTVPFMSFAILCMCISAHVPVINTILYLILGICLCGFSTAWGCVCGVKHMRLDWENEVEVIKQGAAVTVYMLPNLFVVMGLIVGVVFLGMVIDHKILTLIFICIVSILALLSYLRVISLSKKSGQ